MSDKFAKSWNYVPEVPLKVSPFMSLPIEPKRMATWMSARWLSLAENSILVVLATLIWLLFQPSLEEAKSFDLGWISTIYLKNFALIGAQRICAGSAPL